MAILYTNSKGREVNQHSYSAGSDFVFCRRKYYLGRALGWRDREQRASTEFGKCVESAVQYFHANKMKPGCGADEFKRLWIKRRENTELTYTDAEGSWSDLYRMGAEMLALYEVKLPELGIKNPFFQLAYRKEMFPGSELAGLEFVAYVDMKATVDMRVLGGSGEQPIIIDIKTAAKPIDATPDILRLDPQLCSYAWVTGIHDVAFLVFIKARPGFRKGDKVTALVGPLGFPVGSAGVVLSSSEDGTIVLRPEDYEQFEKEVSGLKGKAVEALKEHYAETCGRLFLEPGSITKQKLQFLTTRIPDEDVHETGEIIGQQIADIASANQRNCWPKDGKGLRWPADKCTKCNMRGICIGDNKLRDELLINPNLTEASEKDWLDEFLED